MRAKLYTSWSFFSIKIVDKLYRYVKIKALIFNLEKKKTRSFKQNLCLIKIQNHNNIFSLSFFGKIFTSELDNILAYKMLIFLDFFPSLRKRTSLKRKYLKLFSKCMLLFCLQFFKKSRCIQSYCWCFKHFV